MRRFLLAIAFIAITTTGALAQSIAYSEYIEQQRRDADARRYMMYDMAIDMLHPRPKPCVPAHVNKAKPYAPVHNRTLQHPRHRR